MIFLLQVPQFPVFTRSGEVTVSIDLVHRDLTLSSQELERLINFHHLVFAKVLRLEKDPMRFDFKSAESAYLIIPLSRGKTLDVFINKKLKLDKELQISIGFLPIYFYPVVVMSTGIWNALLIICPNKSCCCQDIKEYSQ